MLWSVLVGLAITLFAHAIARLAGQYWPKLPVVVISLLLVMLILAVTQWPYVAYYAAVGTIFDHLLGYVTVALAIPLAAMRLNDLPLKPLSRLLLIATLMGAILPMGLAWLLHLSSTTLLAFATRAVTTPIAINIADLIHAPAALASLIVILSGLIGAALSPLLLRNLNDERAAGLALGLAAHAIGTVEAWQRGPVAGRYAAFGMAVNGLLTAFWLPLAFHALKM